MMIVVKRDDVKLVEVLSKEKLKKKLLVDHSPCNLTNCLSITADV